MQLPENWDQWLFGAVFALFLLASVFIIFRRGGFKAGLFNAKIQKTFGEVSATRTNLVSQVLKVHALERDGESLIGIEVVSKTVTSYHMLPIVLTEAQARALGSLLRQAGPGH